MRGLVDILRISVTFAVITATPALMALSSAPQSGQAAVLFAPSLDRSAVMLQVAASGAELVRFGGVPGVVVVEMPEDGAAALRRAGAWLVLDPVVLGGCSAPASL